MRFINTSTFKFRELSDAEVRCLENGYSILSHRWTWGSDEITYHDILALDANVKAKGGYSKFAGACALAKALGYDLLWDDTCCINKTDSVELGEAINSMYHWYAESALCIAYLEEVDTAEHIEQSEWFSRGWTLQELIAPNTVQFYDTDWTLLGDKSSLSDVLVRKTGIPADVLGNKKEPRACSVAQRMSWAAGRTTGRLEDRAYSLMGLFDVNMPMIYGERERAFLRLQQQIIANSTDESIFAWDLALLKSDSRGVDQVYSGMMAPSPACFARSGDLVSLGGSAGFHINQFGLNISLPATPITPPLGMNRVLLNVGHLEVGGQYALFLHESGETKYVRVCSSKGEGSVMTEMSPQELVHVKTPLVVTEPPVYIYPGFWLRRLSYDPSHCHVNQLERAYTTEQDRMRLPAEGVGTVGIIQLSIPGTGLLGGLTWIKIGFDPDYLPMCCLVRPLADYHGSASSKLMRTQSADLLRIPRDSAGRHEHPIFDNGWTRSSGEAMPGVQPETYVHETTVGGVDRGFDLTYKGLRFDLSVSTQRVPDMEQRAPAEVWALDVVCRTAPRKEPSPASDENIGCFC
ncbi:ankyrin repeat-containing protein [Apiospora saccharicola]